MKHHAYQLYAFLLVSIAINASAATLYVNLNNLKPAWPYTNWGTAAITIQDAIDAAIPGDVVLVTNGVYQTGGAATYQLLNRIAITKPVRVQSVNGPQVTVIQGFPQIGPSAVRCAYLGDGAALVGFTLTNGATDDFIWYPPGNYGRTIGGGVWCEYATALVSNCVLSGNSSKYMGGGAYGGVLINCSFIGNSSFYGGGAYASTLANCTLRHNSAAWGGGADLCTLNGCVLTENSAWVGAGASGSTLKNSALFGNQAGISGGGASGGTLKNCTLTGNSANESGGGCSGSYLTNCVVYFNSAASAANYEGGEMNFCCTTPIPPAGLGNFAAAPQLTDTFHLQAASPCRGAGLAAYAEGLDLDGEPWLSPPSVGCDEYHEGVLGGPLSVNLEAAYTNIAAGFSLSLTARILGAANAHRWEFSDGTTVSNSLSTCHAWTTPGDYRILLTAYNASFPDGVSASMLVHVGQAAHYVALDSLNPLPPFSSWGTAATNIQDAVDVAWTGARVLVSNGVYRVGARAIGALTNRLVVSNLVAVESLNGPALTSIEGYRAPASLTSDDAIRCVYLLGGSRLAGFTLTNGSTRDGWYEPPANERSGGGVWCDAASAIVSNCVLSGNSAFGGGGAAGGTLYHCRLVANGASYAGGAVSGSTLHSCIIAGNSAPDGGGSDGGRLINCTLVANSAVNSAGGASGGTLYNCILYGNTAPIQPDFSGATLSYCCSQSLADGPGNLALDPLFLDLAAGDFHLQSNSPCINSGNNGYVADESDLDHSFRIGSGTADIGAYEFQGATSTLPYAWLQRFNLALDGSADFADPDHDGMDNWQEWKAGTDPTNECSLLRLLPPTGNAPTVTLSWCSLTNRTYYLERCTDLHFPALFQPLVIGIPGQTNVSAYTDLNAPTSSPCFYRVGIQP